MAEAGEKRLSRRERRNLDIEIGFLEGLVRRDPDYVEALQVLGDDYSDRGRIADSLRVDHRLRELRPDDANVRFNFACSLAIAGKLDDACAELDHALDLGYRDFHWLNKDPDLAELRRHPAFRKLRAKIRKLKSKDRESDDGDL
jgi:tetratricopeptide (TPR) repeat protein